MPGGHTPFGTRATPVFGPRPHSAADFPGTGRFLAGPVLSGAAGNPFRALGPNNIVIACWCRLDAKPAGQSKLFSLADPANPGFAPGDMLGMFYDQPSDQFFAYASNGVGYTLVAPLPALHPVIGTWYQLTAEFAGATISLSVTNPSGVQVGGSVGFTGPYNSPTNLQFAVGALVGGQSPLAGALDSVQLWNSTTTGGFNTYFGAPGAIWNGGKALDFSELPASAPPSSVLQLYLDYDEPTGAGSYADRSPNHWAVTPSGTGIIQRIAGAGY